MEMTGTPKRSRPRRLLSRSLRRCSISFSRWERRSEILRKFDEIVSFADIGQFIDTPVKRYSSGMKVRLGFAVAAFLEPEILFIDEVLAVGDAEFQKKCLGKMSEIGAGGRTVIFVSHDRMFLRGLGSRVLELGGESGTERDPLVYPGSYVEYVQRLGHEAPGIYS